jgi:hypothetical protein
LKVAVQISGLIHAPHDALYALRQNFLDRFDCDIYVASSSPIDDMLIFKPLAYHRITGEDYETGGVNAIIEKHWGNYYLHKDGIVYHSNEHGIFKGLYQKYYCDQLRVHGGIKYDVIFWLRGDLVLGEPFTEWHLEQAQGRILVPFGNDYHGGINDQLCLGDPDSMTKLCDQLLFVDEYMQEIDMHPERMMYHHLVKQKINMAKFSYTYYLKGRFQCDFH